MTELGVTKNPIVSHNNGLLSDPSHPGRSLAITDPGNIHPIATSAVISLWQPIASAPVEPFGPRLPAGYKFRCLLQAEDGTVGEGWAWWYSHEGKPRLRWVLHAVGACEPKYWMPMPEPRA